MTTKPPRKSAGSGRKALEAGVAASLVLGKLSCPVGERTATPTTVEIPKSAGTASGQQENTPPEDAPLAVHVRLREEAVLTSAPARKTLYTWTTREQVEALARDRVLLTRTESPVHGPSRFDQVLAERAEGGNAIAQKLRTQAFARARHAWANPWATILGWPDETYGEELIVVELKPEAWTLVLTESSSAFQLFDADNHELPAPNALLHPERIGAVFFVNDGPGRGPGSTFARGRMDSPAFREYVLCNESMIARWSIGLPAAPVIAASADLVEKLVTAFHGKAPPSSSIHDWNRDVATGTWRLREPPSALVPAYEAAIAFPNELYAPTAERMGVLLARLRGLRLTAPDVSHVPVVPPPASSSAHPQPPPVPRKAKPGMGTWARRGGTF
jgi:hypothetical protein